MLVLKITKNVLGEIERAGVYDNGKWVKWVKIKDIDKYIDIVDEVERM